MKTAHLVELALILPATLFAAVGAPRLTLRLGGLVCVGACLLLGQGLLRDLWLLRLQRRAPASQRRPVACFCVESTVGVGGLLLGASLTTIGLGHSLLMQPVGWAGLTAGVLLGGFLTKDLILVWWPLRLRHDPDHVNLVFLLRPPVPASVRRD